VRIPFGGRNVRGIVTALGTWTPERELEEILGAPLTHPVAPAPLPALYEWLAERYLVPRGRAFERCVPPRVRVKAEPHLPLEEMHGGAALSDYAGGLDLLTAIAHRTPGAWCLQALPSQSRSELLAGLLSALGGDGAALIAVPEVRFGSTALDQLAALFPSLVRVDSASDDMGRSVAWMQMAAGHGLAAGGRAAVFAPAPRLSLIVVDDEHDPAFKEDRTLRYDARRVALERARLQGAICVFVSASPSVEIGAAAAGGSMGSVVPTREARRDDRPLVEVVGKPEDGGLASELHARVRESLKDGGSVALLAPTHGYARVLWCASCRRSVRCSRCEAAVSFERERATIACRRCGLGAAPPDVCPSCKATDFRFLGRGSERYAEQLARSFPRTPLIRMDRLTAEEGPRDWEGTGIYVTTWFGTKPELRPPVALVGVLDADALTRRVDFRAAEHAYQALAEMSQWAGPASGGGRLVIQSDDANHHAIQAIVRGDYSFFLTRELELRRELAYPPFTELVKVSSLGPAAAEVIAEAAEIARAQQARVLGPIEAPFPQGGRDSHGRGEKGLQLLLKCPSAQTVALGLRDILPRVPRGTRLRVDVDPR
jgi:primosomal protein N' (replication factor Y)